MARLSLWKNYKSKDYMFIDRNVKEQFEVGSVGIFVHKYTGPVMADGTANPDIIDELQIQDILLMENRDRTYDPDVYELKGHYTIADHDFDMSQFGLFLQTDTIFVTFHMNEMANRIGRRLMSGDVLEIQNMRDDMGLDGNMNPSRKFYVVQDGSRSADGYSPTWYSHIWRCKCTPLDDSQEFKQILDQTDDDGTSIRDNQSTLSRVLNISDEILAKAEADVPTTTFDTSHLVNFDHSIEAATPAIPSGMTFPQHPRQGDKFLRNDFRPSRTFEFRDNRWHRISDDSQATWADSTLNAGTFTHNDNTTVANGREFNEKQALSKVIKPKTDK